MSEASSAGPMGATPRDVPEVWGNVPQRNKNFTGREELLAELREQVTNKMTAVLAHALHGMGGVGKTQLAIEYAYRHMRDYDVIWWVAADQPPLVRSSLAALAPRLGIEDVDPHRIEGQTQAVLDALRRGQPYRRWLLIFDNAERPDEILELLKSLPSGLGHIIVTSRNHEWEQVADVVEVDVFSRAESLEFLMRRVPEITEDEATRLAEDLGDLPLALEQASALKVEAGMSIDEYLELLAKETSEILAENHPADYPVSMAAAWGLSVKKIQDQTPLAWELLCRLAFFGPEPIEMNLLKKHSRHVLDLPAKTALGQPLMLSRAIRELGRYALARIDNRTETLQVHRLIQKLARDRLSEEQAAAMRHEVHLLLAVAEPEEPEDIDNWPRYAELLAHVVPSEAVACIHPEGRRLVRNIVAYLFQIGDLRTCDRLSRQALEHWTADSGSDDRDVLILAGQRADLLWARGDYQDAYELRQPTLDRMRAVLGPDDEETLQVTNGHGADLRGRGEFAAALQLDESTLALHQRVLGDDHPWTIRVANNLAVDQALNSDYAAALETNTRTYEDRLHFFGRNDHPWVLFSLFAIGRELRQLGRYRDALDRQEQAFEAYADLVRQRTLRSDHQWVLWQAKELSVVRRKMGELGPALDLAEDVYQRYVTSYGEKNPDTLAAGMNVGNARRVYGDVHGDRELLRRAGEQVQETFAHYGEVYGTDHPYTQGCALNLAIVLRRTSDEAGARRLLEDALTGLQDRLGGRHHYTLTCMTALAMSLTETGDVDGARGLGQKAFEGLREVVGPDHPHTLACASNLAIDLRMLGETKQSEELAADTIQRYRKILPDDHLDVKDALERKPIALDFEPPPL